MNGLRSVMPWLVPCLLLVPVIAGAQTETKKIEAEKAKVVDVAAAPVIITRMTGDDLFQRLAGEGLVPERVKENVVRVKMDMVSVLFFVSENNKSVQAFAAFQSESANLAKVNEWNRNKRYSRAYIDGDGDPVIELDLDLAGGVTPARFIDYLTTVRWSVGQYAKHLFD